MRKHTVLGLPVLAACLLAAAAVQQSTKVDFKTSIEKATKANEGKAWGECLKQLRNAMQLVQQSRIDAIRAALPGAPTGMKQEDVKSTDAGMLFAMTWICEVERRFHSDDGEKQITLKVQADSPTIAAMIPMIMNPMVVQASGGEVLEYGKNKAVLSKQGNEGKSWKLQIVIDQAHLIDVDSNGIDKDALLKVLDDAAVAKIAKELGN